MLIFVITHKNKDHYDNKEDSLRSDSRDEHTLDRSVSRGTLFQLIKEIAEEPRAMCHFTVMLIPHIGEYGVREIIILIDEQVDRKIQQRSLPDQVVQLLDAFRSFRRALRTYVQSRFRQ